MLSVPGRAYAAAEGEAVTASRFRRLDDTFRGYSPSGAPSPPPLGEASASSPASAACGSRPTPCWTSGRATTPTTGTARPRAGRTAGRCRPVTGWYDRFAAASRPRSRPRAARPRRADGYASSTPSGTTSSARRAATDTAVRIIWTGDHLDAARRLRAGSSRRPAPRRADAHRTSSPGNRASPFRMAAASRAAPLSPVNSEYRPRP